MNYIERDAPSVGAQLTGGDLLHRVGEGAPPQAGEAGDGDTDTSKVNWLKRASDAYFSSTSYVDSNYRRKWEDSIRAFHNEHALDSKYNSPAFSKRSNLFRPKTRTAIRKNEAAAATAFFSSLDIVSVEAQNQSDTTQLASAEVIKAILQYRLTKSIPWFQVCVGGLQDAQTTGAVAAHVYWHYKQENARTIYDRPCVDLIPIENIRIDQGANWVDPINSSPYVIHLIPMYIGDVRERMDAGEWRSMSVGEIRRASVDASDTTRSERNRGREDPLDSGSKSVSDYELVWIQRHIHRYQGRDYHYYVLGEGIALLDDPVPLDQVVFHGERPYVMGCAILETHAIYPTGIPELTKSLQDETNEVANQRLDNIKFVLNKKWFVKRGRNVDVPSLVRNVPGGVTMCDDPELDIREVNWPDVTASAYAEQDRINADFDDLTGAFNAAAAQISRKGNDPARLTQLMALSGNPMTEYMLRTYVVTFVEPVLRQLVKLEQKYETDEVLLALVGNKAQLSQKYGIDRVTDDLLNQEVNLLVNVGMGATEPMARLQKFLMGMNSIAQVAAQTPPGLKLDEFTKEVMGHLGYQDGSRFFGADPNTVKMQQALQAKDQVIEELMKRLQSNDNETRAKLAIAHDNNQTDLTIAEMQQQGENRRTAAQGAIAIAQAKMGNDSKEKQAANKPKSGRSNR